MCLPPAYYARATRLLMGRGKEKKKNFPGLEFEKSALLLRQEPIICDDFTAYFVCTCLIRGAADLVLCLGFKIAPSERANWSREAAAST